MSEIVINHPMYTSGEINPKIDSIQNTLGNKKAMYDILSKDPRAVEFLPYTITFKVTDQNYKSLVSQLMNKNGSSWILKPALGLQGKDIIVSKKVDQVLNFIRKKRMYSEWVISEYIDNPFLLKINGKSLISKNVFNDTIGRKVSIRVYGLVTKMHGDTHIYMYDESLIFSAVCQYRFNDLKYRYSNLTNLHLGSIYYKKYLKINGDNAYKDLSFPLKETVNSIYGDHFYNEKVLPQIKKMFKVIIQDSEKLIKCEKINSKTFGCFHRIAVDIMPDDNFKLKLLEINAYPGMNAPEYHWGTLDKYLNGIVDITTGKNNNKFILIS